MMVSIVSFPLQCGNGPFPCEALAFFQILQILKLKLRKNIQSQIQTVMFVDYVFWKVKNLRKCSNNVDNIWFLKNSGMIF